MKNIPHEFFEVYKALIQITVDSRELDTNMAKMIPKNDVLNESGEEDDNETESENT